MQTSYIRVLSTLEICFLEVKMWSLFSLLSVTQGGSSYNGVTSGLIHRENGRRFLTPLVCADRLLTGWKAACSGKSGVVRHRPARAKAAFHPVSRQLAQTSGVRKRLPFSTRVIKPVIESPWCNGCEPRTPCKFEGWVPYLYRLATRSDGGAKHRATNQIYHRHQTLFRLLTLGNVPCASLCYDIPLGFHQVLCGLLLGGRNCRGDVSFIRLGYR